MNPGQRVKTGVTCFWQLYQVVWNIAILSLDWRTVNLSVHRPPSWIISSPQDSGRILAEREGPKIDSRPSANHDIEGYEPVLSQFMKIKHQPATDPGDHKAIHTYYKDTRNGCFY